MTTQDCTDATPFCTIHKGIQRVPTNSTGMSLFCTICEVLIQPIVQLRFAGEQNALGERIIVQAHHYSVQSPFNYYPGLYRRVGPLFCTITLQFTIKQIAPRRCCTGMSSICTNAFLSHGGNCTGFPYNSKNMKHADRFYNSRSAL
ncbi:hypothetical protein K474DRAFT_243797 [Panus rudis PR-1116 ss-1]|nr:hypothetical protein K474DRAFT_243797 [Panus rudis PR-1116 ss-1]